METFSKDEEGILAKVLAKILANGRGFDMENLLRLTTGDEDDEDSPNMSLASEKRRMEKEVTILGDVATALAAQLDEHKVSRDR
jgi:hypothetical protein